MRWTKLAAALLAAASLAGAQTPGWSASNSLLGMPLGIRASRPPSNAEEAVPPGSAAPIIDSGSI
jgi:hypothetical protein